MKPLHISFKDGLTADEREGVLDAINQSSSLDEFVQLWLSSRQGEVSFSLGNEPSPVSSPHLRVVAHRHDAEVADLLYALEPLKELFPNVKPVDHYIKGFDSFGRCIFDDDAFDAFEEGLGYEYNDDLCGPLGPRESVLQIVLSYIASGNGEVHISRYHPADPDEPCLDSESFDPNDIFSLSLLYRAPREVRGCIPMFGTFLYVHAQGSSIGLQSEQPSAIITSGSTTKSSI